MSLRIIFFNVITTDVGCWTDGKNKGNVQTMFVDCGGILGDFVVVGVEIHLGLVVVLLFVT